MEELPGPDAFPMDLPAIISTSIQEPDLLS